MDFSDFLFFVSAFGSRLNDGKYETKYDLDGNGEIAFDDFLIFVSSFGKSVDTIAQPYATKRVATSSDFLNVCDRTPQVRDAIVTALGATDCGSVTEQNLSNLTDELDLDIESWQFGESYFGFESWGFFGTVRVKTSVVNAQQFNNA